MKILRKYRYSLLVAIGVFVSLYLCNTETERPSRRMLPSDEDETTFPSIDVPVTGFHATPGQSTHMPTVQKDRSGIPPYLLPIFRFGSGPNNQYRSFKIAIRFAIHFNRTLVLGPFFNHILIDKKESRAFNETFDVASLSAIVPVASIEQFYNDCDGVIDKIVHGKPFIHSPKDYEYYIEKYKRTRRRFTYTTGIRFPGLGSIPKSSLGSAQRFKNATASPCLAFYTPFTIDYEFMNLTSPISTDEFYKMGKLIEEYVVRSTQIRQVTDVFERIICNGAPYMVVHWRINDDFMNLWCNALKSPECKLFRELNETGEFIGKQIQQTMDRYRVKCIYVARPPGSWNLVKHLRGFTSKVYTSSEIVRNAGNELSFLWDDNYFLSLVEQELAYRSSLFIGSSGSSWTCFVKRERQLRDAPTVSLSEILGFPESTCL
ncbi:uncharacterized protein LOC102809347 [Saccoglossus kowalevskii]|uniref:GDP-fucose protein O-fucosyltransferase 2 n=1 Tax=Saccoglossus kowalevskii TaxID=10224 RepID=A0ABM0MQ89_SACKO|nr:PREDICTED: uncharacterized protein LOC102809347 [Saccoglossus kowalevskii]